MISRHLETSEEAQPDHLKRPVANNGDLEAMGRCFAWGAANGFTPEQIANGQDYPAAEISDAEEAETT